VEGESLWARLYREGRLPEAEAVRIIVQIAEGVAAAHRKRYIHRDIKPDNILLASSGDAKLADLGLVKSLDADINLTQNGNILGTPNYIAPEQFENACKVDERADVYGLGATLYSAVTGDLPFKVRGQKNYLAILKRKLMNDLTEPRKLVPDLSETVDFAIRRATRADRKQRHASCEEFIAALTGAGRPEAPAESRRRAATLSRKVERRAAIRFQAGLESNCETLALLREKRWPARVHDISVSGIRIVLPRRFERGTLLTLEIQSKDQRSNSSHVVRVIRASQDRSRQWTLGCKFIRELTPLELKALL
jgi:serine/threonine protein kinase